MGALAILYLFMLQEGSLFSRKTLILTVIFYCVLTYLIRELWKYILRKKMKDGGDRKLLIITSKDIAEKTIKNMQKNNYARYSRAGGVVVDDEKASGII